MTDLDPAVEAVAIAFFCAIWESDEAWELASDSQKDTTRQWTRAAVAALELTEESDRRRNCVCRHPMVDHDMYRSRKCQATLCPCIQWQSQRRVRLVGPWRVVDPPDQPTDSEIVSSLVPKWPPNC